MYLQALGLSSLPKKNEAVKGVDSCRFHKELLKMPWENDRHRVAVVINKGIELTFQAECCL